MNAAQWLLAALCALLLTPLWLLLHRALRHRLTPALAQIPPDWHADLQRHSALYRRTPPALRLRTVARALQFIAQKHFVGCNELTVTPAMQRVIAFQACLLIDAHGLDAYAELASVLVYPGAFVVEQQQIDAAGVVSTDSAVLIGQSIDVMRIVLSWPDVLAAGSERPGYNVVIHEFAHFLDHALEGALSAPQSGSDWHTVLEREYQALRTAAHTGAATLIDPYGSTDPAEFFAVATETFIELPQQLRSLHPQLYAVLAWIYRLDPAIW